MPMCTFTYINTHKSTHTDTENDGTNIRRELGVRPFYPLGIGAGAWTL